MDLGRSSKYLCFRASEALMRSSGFNRSIFCVWGHKYFQEFDSIITQFLHDGFERVGLSFLKFEFVPERKFLESWHCLGVRCSENLEDSVELFLDIFAWENGPKAGHFRKDTPNRPDIDGGGIVLWAQQNIRGAIPQSDYLVSVTFGGNSRGSSKSEISYFQYLVLVEE